MQVAVTVAFPAVAFVEQRELVRIRSFDVGFATEEYLSEREINGRRGNPTDC